MIRELMVAEETLLKTRPVLKQVLLEHGDAPLIEYARYFAPKHQPPENAHELIDEISLQTQELLGQERSESVASQLHKTYAVGTADHHGPLTHPFFVHSNLLNAAAVDTENVIVLATSNVSLGNSSHPRGLLLSNTDGDYVRANLFPTNARNTPVFRCGPYTKDGLDGAIKSLEWQPDAQNLVRSVYEKAFDVASFSEQVTVTNSILWKKFFGASTLPSLVYLELEAIVARVLLKHHMHGGTALNALLFDTVLRDKAHILLNGVQGSHTTETLRGTFLFWYLPENESVRHALYLRGNQLQTLDGGHCLPMTPEFIENGLRTRILIPSTMLSLMTVSCHYGLTCLGGYSQVNYLTQYKRVYQELFPDSAITTGETDILGADFGIASLSLPGGQLSLATGVDLALYTDDSSLERFKHAASLLCVRDSLRLLMPDLLLPERQRSAARKALLEDLKDSIPPCASMS